MPFQQKSPDARVGQIIKLAVMAVGGQGGGVLTGWIEALARSQGCACQATSVAGVAQRTGATIYYVEMLPKSELEPVFALIADTHKASDLRCVSVDVPSGLTDAGPVTDRPSGVFQADLTVTFHALKAAHRSGAAFCGRIIVKDIGL